MIDVFNINDLVYIVNAHAEQKEDGVGGNSYKEVLDSIRRIISQNHSSELVGILYSQEAGDRLKNLIVRYINQNRFSVTQIGNIAELTDRIYEDMAGFGILTKYLSDSNVEEININAWNSIEVVYPEGVKRPEETFLSPEDCMDKIKKMVWLGGSIIDGSNPTVDSFIGEGVRISAIIPPCVDKKTGGVASIRRQKKNVITKELMLQYQSATEEELSFLSLCVNHGVSLAIAGSTGSGKTTDLGYLIGCLGKDKRIYTIEDTRELNITRLDEKGHMLNRVVQTVTKDEGGRVTMDDLLKKALRFHPDVIIPAEMRGQEAMTAIEAGRTGHTIITTLHSNSALDAYNRILSMCVSTGVRLSESKLMEFVLEAIPLILFKRQLPDGRRIYDEIFEGLQVSDGKIIGQTLYKFEIEENIYNANGQIVRVIGRHKKIHSMSRRLLLRLQYGGASAEMLRRFVETGGEGTDDG